VNHRHVSRGTTFGGSLFGAGLAVADELGLPADSDVLATKSAFRFDVAERAFCSVGVVAGALPRGGPWPAAPQLRCFGLFGFWPWL
jgi:hypothetical protein